MNDNEKKNRNTKWSAWVLFGLLGALQVSWGQFPLSHTGCANLQPSDFEITALFSHTNRDEVDEGVSSGTHTQHSGAHNLIRFDFLKNGNDFDIFFGGFEGVLYRYNSQNKQITSIKNFNTIKGSVNNPYKGGDNGLTGIAFHPNFENNRWVFVFYTPSVSNSQNRVHKLSRFEMNGQYQLQNEKVLLSMEATTTDQWHSGGDMYFTAHGDLFLQVGDNVAQDNNNTSKTNNAMWTSGNTSNLLGGIVRIHPDSSTKGYSVPKGNFGEHFAPLMNDVNYLNPVRVLPEIFAKGQRSNFTSTGHPTELIHIWGEVNTAGSHDEINIVNKPVYGGWPHFQGNGNSNRTGGTSNRYSHGVNDAPELNSGNVNLSWVPNAVTRLPNVYPADIVVGGTFNTAMAHAMYYYGRGDSIWEGRTFPPHFHETFMFNGYHKNTQSPRIVPIAKGESPTAQIKNSTYDIVNLFTNNKNKLENAFVGVVEAKYGPDGALYVLSRARNTFAGGGQYSSNTNDRPGLLTRIDYTGNCQDTSLFEINRDGMLLALDSARDANRYRAGFYDASLYDPEYTSVSQKFLNGKDLLVGSAVQLDVFNIHGQKVYSLKTSISKPGTFPKWNKIEKNGSQTQEGIYLLQYTWNQGKDKWIQKQVVR